MLVPPNIHKYRDSSDCINRQTKSPTQLLTNTKIFDGNYDIVAEGCVALIFLLISCVCNIYRAFSNRCPHCGKIRLSNGKYCSHCGKEI